MGKNVAQPRRDGGKPPTVTPPSVSVVTMSSIAMMLPEQLVRPRKTKHRGQPVDICYPGKWQ